MIIDLIFILISIILSIGILYEVIISQDTKLLELNKDATKKQKLLLIKKATLKSTKKQIRKCIFQKKIEK